MLKGGAGLLLGCVPETVYAGSARFPPSTVPLPLPLQHTTSTTKYYHVLSSTPSKTTSYHDDDY